MSNDIGDRTTMRFSLAVLGLVLALLVVDLVGDSRQDVGVGHLAIEAIAAALAAVGMALLIVRFRTLDRQQHRMRRRLVESEAAAAQWRDEAAALLAGLRAAIEAQLDAWGLSPAEREVALLLLQGLSHKQIASRRSVSERTVRQQAHVLYRKAGLGGRADLAAFFLAGLLPAATDAPTARRE